MKDGRTCIVDYQYFGVAPRDFMAMVLDNPRYEKIGTQVRMLDPGLEVTPSNLDGLRVAALVLGSGFV